MQRSERASQPEHVVVVGTGPCGAMAAAQLSRHGVAVTVLDAGRRVPRGLIVRAAGNTVFRWREKGLIDDDRHEIIDGHDVVWNSSRSLGGLSNYWTAAVPRFAPEDFTEGGAVDERFVWPVRYEDLVPYYELAEHELCITAGCGCGHLPANVARYHTAPPDDWEQVAHGVRAAGAGLCPIPMAKGKPWMIAARGTEFSSYPCVLERHVEQQRIRLIRGAIVTRLNWNSATQRVDSVTYIDRETNELVTMPARAVVLAAGAVDSTMVLLRSVSSDFPDGLGNSNGLVGRYLHDHPREWWVGVPKRPMTALAHPLYIPRGQYDSAQALCASSLTLGLAHWSHRPRTWLRAKVDRFGVQVFGTMIPRPDTGVSLPSRPDVSDGYIRPTIVLRYDQPAMNTLSDARERLVETLALGSLEVSVPGPFHEVVPGSSVHFGGTIRMHDSPEHGALDRWNRLRDAPNVRVVDLSCFTTGPEKNPTLTAMALATRAAAHLAEELSAG
ncbi:MAG: GMC family oxidoreductase [Acidimicrobiales bacterium]